MEPGKPVADEGEEDEWDYDDQGELVKVAKPASPEPRYPVPPLDLPHYHGLELGTGGDGGLAPHVQGGSGEDRSPRGDTTTKEVTGA